MFIVTPMIKLLIPANSKRGIKFRDGLSRIRSRRARNYSRKKYNLNRQKYYNNALTKISAAESLTVSIVVPCFNTPKKYFEPLLASLFAQGYQNWELILIDASDKEASAKYLSRKANSDTRIKYIKTSNEGIALNTNKGISVATGDLVAFLDHDDTLDQDALSESVGMFANQPSLGLVYSDEDKISDDGEEYFEPHFKPDFSLDMLRNVNYITHFVVARKSVVDKIQGIRTGFDGAQDYDFLLRVVDEGIEIGHVPKILYHWRQAEGSTAADFSNKSHVTDAGCKALADHYKRRNIRGVKVEAIKNRPGFYTARYALEEAKRCIYVNLESLDLSSLEKEYVLDRYRRNNDVNKYNISVLEGKPRMTAEPTLIVNGAYIPLNHNTDISSLFGLSEEKGVAGVSPKIVRHGRIYDMGIIGHGKERKYLFKGVNPDRQTGFGSVEWVRNVDELTGAVSIENDFEVDNEQRRKVVWSHAEFIALIPGQTKTKTNTNTHNFYNPNLIELTEITEDPTDSISELVEIKK